MTLTEVAAKGMWPKWLLLTEGVSFGVKCFRYDDFTSNPVALGADMKPLVLSNDHMVRMHQESKPYYKREPEHPRSLWQWFDVEPMVGKTPRRLIRKVDQPERMICLD